jgi:outer membrane protein insertion porin family
VPVLGRVRRTGGAGLLLLALLAATEPLRASDAEHGLPEIQGIEFRGNEHFGADELRRQMEFEFRSLLHPFRPQPRFRRNTFSRELRRVEVFYARQGFGGAHAWLDSLESVAEGRGVRLHVRVREGPRTLIREVRFYPQPIFSLDELRRLLPFEAGDPFPFSPALLGRGTRALRLAFLARGYLAVGVEDSTFISADSTTARLEYRMDPGPQFTVRAVSVSGNVQTHQELIRRELRIAPGEIYSYTRVQESQQNLYSTSLFRTVSVREDNLDVDNRTVDLAVRVIERQMAFVEGSVGVGRRDEIEARLSGAWGHRNLFGRGHALEIRSTLAYNLEQKGNNYIAEQRLRYAQPHFFGTRVRFEPEVAYTIEQRQDGVRFRRFQLDAPASFKAGRFTTIALGATAAFTTTELEKELLSDDLLQTRALTLSVTRNSSDDLFNPRRGEVRSIAFQRAGFDGDNYFTRATAAWFRYQAFGRTVLALGLRTGWVESFGPSRSEAAASIGIRGVPLEYLFEAGGNTTVRGYSNRSLGPSVTARRRDLENDPGTVVEVTQQAGTVLLIGNLEARMPMPWLARWHVGLVGFVDAGNVWRDLEALKKAPFGVRFDDHHLGRDDMRYSYGFGFRYQTPVGPVRLDVGFPMKRWGRRVIHIGLGHTF